MLRDTKMQNQAATSSVVGHFNDDHQQPIFDQLLNMELRAVERLDAAISELSCLVERLGLPEVASEAHPPPGPPLEPIGSVGKLRDIQQCVHDRTNRLDYVTRRLLQLG